MRGPISTAGRPRLRPLIFARAFHGLDIDRRFTCGLVRIELTLEGQRAQELGDEGAQGVELGLRCRGDSLVELELQGQGLFYEEHVVLCSEHTVRVPADLGYQGVRRRARAPSRVC